VKRCEVCMWEDGRSGAERPDEGRNVGREEQPSPTVRRSRAINIAEGKIGKDLAGDNSLERVGTGDPAECQISEQNFRRVTYGHKGRSIKRVSDPDMLKGMVQRIAGRGGETCA